ncbi:hypothetical protein PoB_001875400 [Plakobranchus ocellatus]|uniref:Uncharacterized protein n=1 Tax=Plakobranchus ocellatus TaxID=259542 RepID=A0AAV3ZA93_9GAST|nr:hypothetical protein PoB_001875400 [Plakobranchus ocellatus]
MAESCGGDVYITISSPINNNTDFIAQVGTGAGRRTEPAVVNRCRFHRDSANPDSRKRRHLNAENKTSKFFGET